MYKPAEKGPSSCEGGDWCAFTLGAKGRNGPTAGDPGWEQPEDRSDRKRNNQPGCDEQAESDVRKQKLWEVTGVGADDAGGLDPSDCARADRLNQLEGIKASFSSTFIFFYTFLISG